MSILAQTKKTKNVIMKKRKRGDVTCGTAIGEIESDQWRKQRGQKWAL